MNTLECLYVGIMVCGVLILTEGFIMIQINYKSFISAIGFSCTQYSSCMLHVTGLSE